MSQKYMYMTKQMENNDVMRLKKLLQNGEATGSMLICVGASEMRSHPVLWVL